mgnify:CR=1 FL=1
MKLPWSKSESSDKDNQLNQMTSSSNQPSEENKTKQPPILNFGSKRYDLNSLPDELKELVKGMQVAEAQIRMHQDTLKVLSLGRQTLGAQISEKLKSEKELPEKED